MSFISSNYDVKSIIFSQFWSLAFSPNCWQKPCYNYYDIEQAFAGKEQVQPDPYSFNYSKIYSYLKLFQIVFEIGYL